VSYKRRNGTGKGWGGKNALKGRRGPSKSLGKRVPEGWRRTHSQPSIQKHGGRKRKGGRQNKGGLKKKGGNRVDKEKPRETKS